MSRAPVLSLLFACLVGNTVLPGEAWATPRPGAEAEPGSAPQALVLPRTAIAGAVRRTAVADPDLNGEVTGGEAAKYYDTRFRLLDENRDGEVDAPEFLRAAAVRSLHVVDGFAQPRPFAFESVDVDGNGTLTPEEFLRAELMRRSASMAGGLDGRRQRIFDAIDTDHDDALSRQEFADAGVQDFLRSDADGDGRVSIWEFYSGTRL